MKKLLFLTAFFLVTFFTLTIPIGTSLAADTPRYGGTLRIIWQNSPGSFGYPPEVLGDNTNAPKVCFDSFLREQKGVLIPWLAESYAVADDLKSITFKLRKGVKFHDGTDFNAEAAKWNLDNHIEKKIAPEWDSIDIIDDYTIRVNLKRWRNIVLSLFADTINSWMASPTAFKKNGMDWIRQNPVGTGPFKFSSFKRDVNMLHVRNPDYWQKGKPYLDAIDNLFVPDPTSQFNLMKSGGADMVVIDPGKWAADYKAAGFKIETQIDMNYVLIPDTANADSPYANIKVREAVEYAIDREAIAKGLGYGYWKAPYQIPAEDTMAYNPDFSLGRLYNVAKAKQLLSEAGYPNGFKTTVISAPAGRNKDLSTAVQAYLAKVGIQAEVLYPDQPKFLTYQVGSYHNAMIIQPAGGYYNNERTTDFYFAPTSPRFKSWTRSSEFIRLWNASSTTRTPDVKLMRAYNDQLIKEAAVIPIGAGGKTWVVQPYVRDAGFYERSFGTYFSEEKIWLSK